MKTLRTKTSGKRSHRHNGRSRAERMHEERELESKPYDATQNSLVMALDERLAEIGRGAKMI